MLKNVNGKRLLNKRAVGEHTLRLKELRDLKRQSAGNGWIVEIEIPEKRRQLVGNLIREARVGQGISSRDLAAIVSKMWDCKQITAHNFIRNFETGFIYLSYGKRTPRASNLLFDAMQTERLRDIFRILRNYEKTCNPILGSEYQIWFADF